MMVTYSFEFGQFSIQKETLVGVQDRHGLKVYEYAVASVNGNGEGALSPVENTDPASWKNWYPAVTLKFKRQSAFWMPPYMSANMSPEKYYPD